MNCEKHLTSNPTEMVRQILIRKVWHIQIRIRITRQRDPFRVIFIQKFRLQINQHAWNFYLPSHPNQIQWRGMCYCTLNSASHSLTALGRVILESYIIPWKYTEKQSIYSSKDRWKLNWSLIIDIRHTCSSYLRPNYLGFKTNWKSCHWEDFMHTCIKI